PDLAHRYGPLPSHKWRDCFRARIDDLAAALDARCPDLLGAQLAWARCAFAARDVPAEDLSAGCEALREAIGAAVAPEDRALIESYFARALEQAGRASGAVPGALAPDAPHGCLAARYLLALLEGDRRRALALVRDALAAGVPTRELHIHVFAPVL